MGNTKGALTEPSTLSFMFVSPAGADRAEQEMILKKKYLMDLSTLNERNVHNSSNFLLLLPNYTFIFPYI